MKYAFAGDREISCNILKFIMSRGYKPSMLFVTKNKNTTHAEELIKISGLTEEHIVRGKSFSNIENVLNLQSLNLDYIIGIHYPYIIPVDVLECPKVGFLNLHPAYLPFNKGWHTPSWAILDKTEYGATLHFMAESLDTGDIIHQKRMKVELSDTANTLYQRVLKLEEEVFVEAFPDLLSLKPNRKEQKNKGTSHNKKDLNEINTIDLEEVVKARDLIDKLRALTTNSINEAAYYIENNKKYALQIKISKLD